MLLLMESDGVTNTRSNCCISRSPSANYFAKLLQLLLQTSSLDDARVYAVHDHYAADTKSCFTPPLLLLTF